MNQEPSKDVHHIVPDFHANHRIQVGHHLVDDNKKICQLSGFAMRERTSGAAAPPAQRSHRVWQPRRPPWYHQQG